MNRKINFDNRNNNQQCFKSGGCPKAGIKIHHSDNDYRTNPTNKDIYNASLNQLDLAIENYELQDLYKLFNINDGIFEID